MGLPKLRQPVAVRNDAAGCCSAFLRQLRRVQTGGKRPQAGSGGRCRVRRERIATARGRLSRACSGFENDGAIGAEPKAARAARGIGGSVLGACGPAGEAGAGGWDAASAARRGPPTATGGDRPIAAPPACGNLSLQDAELERQPHRQAAR